MMLVLSRKVSETVLFPNLNVTIQVLNVKGSKVNLGIDAPKSINIIRGELKENKESQSETRLDEEQARVLSLMQEAKELVLNGQLESATWCLKESICNLQNLVNDQGIQAECSMN